MLKQINSSREQGSLLVMALLIMMILVILGTAAISLASMERKVSQYYFRELKAQEAADAGVEWALALALEQLNDNNPATGPGRPAEKTKSLGSGSEQVYCKITDTSDKPEAEKSYTYTFKSQGICLKDNPQEVSRSALVSAFFAFDKTKNEYQRGSIISYKIE